MVFSSIPFLFYFLPCVLIVYFAAPRCVKNVVLMMASLVFYGWGEPRYIVLMALSVIIGYVSGLLIDRARSKNVARWIMITAVTITLGFLGYFKYADFFIENVNAVTGLSIPLLRLALPIGISFYTFQIISYIIDVYRKTVEVQRSFIDLAAYVTMFPQLIAGPIVRYSDIARQLRERQHSVEMISSGIGRFVTGLAKKVLIANVLGELCTVFRESTEQSVLFYWVYAVSYCLQIYFDFSGYSDMAIGLGRVFGFDFIENFRYPFISSSVTEFWRRWHISLGSWFRDYVYIPLGGNRVSTPRHILNLLIVWMLTGFWHGAAWNFILWGLYFAVLLILEKFLLLRFLKSHRVISHVYVVLMIIISFVIFNATNMTQLWQDLCGLFGAGGLPLVSDTTLYYLRSYAMVLVVGLLGATPLFQTCIAALRRRPAWNTALTVAEPIALTALFLTVVAYLVDGSFNPFLYFRF